MKIAVLGSGVIGVSSAYYLAKQGFEVVVVDRQPAPAEETSFANAGQISPGYSAPWAAPGIPLKAMKWLFQRHAPLAMKLDGSLFQLSWLAKMLSNCTHTRYAVNKERMMRLAEYSRDVIRELRQDIGLQYEGRAQGTLQVFRTQAQLDAAHKDIAVLKQCGVPYQLLTPQQCVEYEPALALVASKLTGGLRLPNDETGDCRLFTQGLAEAAKALGVTFRFGETIQAVEMAGGKVSGVRLASGLLHADAYVLALGSYSTSLARQIGLDIPVYPVKGYSLTVPITDSNMAPVSTVMDETYKVAITRFDNRIRVGGMAELAGFDLGLNPRRRETLELVVGDLFPKGGDIPAASFWTGLRPMTPDGTPILGRTPIDNLLLNTGHGTLGWTMACGSGRVLADIAAGRSPEIRADDLAIERYFQTTPMPYRPSQVQTAGR